MAVIKCKGTALQIASGTTYSSVAQITQLGISGSQTETVEVRTLDGSAGIPYVSTGYVEGGNVTFDLLYDPALAGHQTVTDLITSAHLLTTGAQNTQQWKVVFANTASTEMTFVSAGIGADITVDPANALRGSLSLKCDGCPAFPT
jgi:hypothetical protein